jgi:hypothetical protein
MFQETQLIAFLRNAPGELAKLCELMRTHSVNILAMSIQNAEDYLRGLFRAREITGRRIAPAVNYGSVIKDSEDYSVIRFVVEHDQSEEAIRLLREAGYSIETTPVIMMVLKNEPGMLGAMAETLARERININYVYGSAMNGAEEALFILHVGEEVFEKAIGLLKQGSEAP